MKTMEIKSLGLEEVVADEAVNIDGGAVIPWPVIIKILEGLGAAAMGFAAGWYMYEASEEVEEFYGGELDPAICYG